VRFLQGGPGLAWRLGGFMPYGFILGRVENASPWSSFLTTGGGAELGVVYQQPALQADLGARAIQFDNGFRRERVRARVTLPLAQNHAVRGVCEHHGWDGGGERDECRLEWRYYYD